MTTTRWFAGAMALAVAGPVVAAAPASKVPPEVVKFEQSLHKQTGDVAVPGAHATLHLGTAYYFLPADEARTVLTEVWGNPPESADGVLGLVFPAGKTIYDNVWGAVVTFEDTGYVPDKDADKQDYGEVLSQMQEAADDSNAERAKQGYPEVHLVGWAQPPSYNRADHSLIWARDLDFSDSEVDTLNYDVRLLGRHGVLSLNMLSTMNDLTEVRSAATAFGHAASFDRGETYADFDSSIDKTAEYGLAGLVAAGAGLVVAKKLGFLALALGLGKKLIVLVAIGFAAARKWLGKLFRRNRDDEGDGGLPDEPAEV